MQTIDEISIGREGDMFTLTIYHYPEGSGGTPKEGRSTRFLIGLPDQFHSETQRTIGQWLTPAVEPQPLLPTDGICWPYTTHPVTDAQEGDDD